MKITIDIASATAVYEQIIEGIEQLIRDGSLRAGSVLPPIRQLASDLEINPNTVAKSYKILESKHIIKSAGRRGTFVQDNALQSFSRSMKEEAALSFQELLKRLAAKGVTLAELRESFEQAVAQLEK